MVYEPIEYELNLSTDQLFPALRQISTQTDTFVTAKLRLDTTRTPVRLILDETPSDNHSRTGADFAPLADWIAVAMPGGSPPDDPSDWIERLKPSYAQLLVVLLLGFGANRSDWRGWVIQRGSVRRLAGIRGMGRNMFQTTPTSQEFLEKNDDRWSRTVNAVGLRAFIRLRESTVVVVGCSGTGSQVATMLAALAVRRIGLIDGDIVEPHNLSRMLIASESDVGQNKAMVVARHLTSMRSDMAIMVSDQPFAAKYDDPATHGADLIVTCVDRDTPRLRAAHLARERMIPHLDIGTGVNLDERGNRRLAADVRLLLPQSGCIRCVGGLIDLTEANYELRAPYGALPRKAPSSWNSQGRLGSLVTLNSIAAATAVQSWVDLLDGSQTTGKWNRILWNPGGSLETESANVAASHGCELCRRSNEAI